jgi:hypothetical protein
VHGKEAARGPIPTLASALVVVRAAYGDAWYYAPERWKTADGYAPFKMVWAEYAGLQTLEARRRMEHADGVGLAMQNDRHKSKQVRDSLLRAAYPGEALPH